MPNKGIELKLTESQRLLRSKIVRERWANPDYRERMKLRKKPDYKKVSSTLKRTLLENPDIVRKRWRNLKNNEAALKERNKKVSNGLKNYLAGLTEEQKYKRTEGAVLSSSQKRKGKKNPEHSKRLLEHYSHYTENELRERFSYLHKSAPKKKEVTNIEKRIHQLLAEMHLKFSVHPDIRGLTPDILLLDFPIIIECDGDYWHSLPGNIKSDKRRNRIFREAGYQVIHLLGSEIENAIPVCRRKILRKVKTVLKCT